jgi:hypothetical protein
MSDDGFFDRLFGIDLRPDPAWEEAKRRLWAMTADERRAAMYAGELSLRLCLHWANHAPREVPLAADGEWLFIAVHTPEFADECDAPAGAAAATVTARHVLRPAPR